MFKIGCCGFPISQEKYFKEFSVIEIQQSFYRTLTEKQVKNWKSKAPGEFEFVLKAPQYITHPPTSPTYRRADLVAEKRKFCGGFRINSVTEEIMETFHARASLLGAKKFVFQTPASFRPTDENIKNLLVFFKHYRGRGVFIWEPRGKDWTTRIIKDICKEAGLIHAVDPFLHGLPVFGEFTYFRLHGDLHTYRYSYSDDELKRIIDMAAEVGYFMFNNSDMYNNAHRLKEILKNLSP